MNTQIEKLIRKYRVETLLKNGPASRRSLPRHDGGFAPARIIRDVIKGGGESFPLEIWESIECIGTADPKIDFAGFIRDIRAQAFETGLRDVPAYGGVLRTIAEIAAAKRRKQDRLAWITADMRTAARGQVLLFVGDLPYYEEIFASELGFSPLDTARGAVRLLNAIGIVPAVMKDEVPSGIDQLWSGDVRTFRKLAERNIDAITRTAAKKIVVLDSESLLALRKEYRRFFSDFRLPVVHITQLLAGKLNKLKFDKTDDSVAYHDPCRLGGLFKIFEQPRQILTALLKGSILKTKRERENSLCTGAHRFSNYGTASKSMQLDVLKEAEKAGAEILVTSCPREAINLKLATKSESWKQTNIEIRELTSLAGGLYKME